MENKKNGCGCNKPTKEGGAESMPASPKPIEMRAGKGTMTRVGNEIFVGERAFPDLRGKLPKFHMTLERDSLKEVARSPIASSSYQRTDAVRPKESVTMGFLSGFELGSSFNAPLPKNRAPVIESGSRQSSVFLTDFSVPLAGAAGQTVPTRIRAKNTSANPRLGAGSNNNQFLELRGFSNTQTVDAPKFLQSGAPVQVDGLDVRALLQQDDPPMSELKPRKLAGELKVVYKASTIDPVTQCECGVTIYQADGEVPQLSNEDSDGMANALCEVAKGAKVGQRWDVTGQNGRIGTLMLAGTAFAPPCSWTFQFHFTVEDSTWPEVGGVRLPYAPTAPEEPLDEPSSEKLPVTPPPEVVKPPERKPDLPLAGGTKPPLWGAIKVSDVEHPDAGRLPQDGRPCPRYELVDLQFNGEEVEIWSRYYEVPVQAAGATPTDSEVKTAKAARAARFPNPKAIGDRADPIPSNLASTALKHFKNALGNHCQNPCPFLQDPIIVKADFIGTTFSVDFDWGQSFKESTTGEWKIPVTVKLSATLSGSLTVRIECDA